MGFPPFSREKLERGTGLALRALSSWCWSQDPALDFHLVSSPVSTTENLPTFTEESQKYLPGSAGEVSRRGSRIPEAASKRAHWGSSESCSGATHSTPKLHSATAGMDLLSEGTTTCTYGTGAPAKASENRVQQARASAGAKAALSRAGGAGEESRAEGWARGWNDPRDTH